ncbi:histidine kinase [Nocardioides sp. InS609-2]|uniref:histidine kinase n=1 Tax=Nocardioides sp. InS609-2 TaxID=2760705 RepID=UPI0020BD48D3|nr:histidine kinase [Nocardioides sp. InS609-2]
MEEPRPEQYQPPLRWNSHAWRLALCVGISLLVWVPVAEAQAERYPLFLVLDLGLGAIAYVLVFWRRRWPFAIAVILGVMSLFSGIAAGPGTLAAVSLATRRRLVPIVIAGVVALVAGQGYTDMQPYPNDDPVWLTFAFSTVITIGIMGWGMFIGSRRELMWTLENRAIRAETEQELRSEQARGNERSRIAREMHDVLAHRISQISMHSGALAFRSDLDADALREGIAEIHGHANDALTDLRGVLGVLRDEDGRLTHQPQPTYDDLPDLVAEARTLGMHVEFNDLLDGQSPPEIVGRTLYRIVQEGLTNARKHAPGALVTVEVSGGPDTGVDVVMRNPLGFGRSVAPTSGLGLIGLSERTLLRGGHLKHRREGAEFVLHGWIPWAV